MSLFNEIKRQVVRYFNGGFRVVRLIFWALGRPVDRKYILNWLVSQRPNYLIEQAIPWICYPAWDYLKQHLPKNIIVFEYGSGASTLAWLKRFEAKCVSVEHDTEWYTLILAKLRAAGFGDRIDYRQISPSAQDSNKLNKADPYDPNLYIDDSLNGSFKEYVCQIDEFPDNHFDLIIVDGRSRPACILHSLKKVKVGGFLLVDNSDRPYFKHLQMKFSEYVIEEFDGLLPSKFATCKTTIFRRIIDS